MRRNRKDFHDFVRKAKLQNDEAVTALQQKQLILK
jgi:hypothetical protein